MIELQELLPSNDDEFVIERWRPFINRSMEYENFWIKDRHEEDEIIKILSPFIKPWLQHNIEYTIIKDGAKVGIRQTRLRL